VEIVLQLLGELLLELGFHSTGDSFRDRSRAHPLLGRLGALLLGAIAGALTRIAWPGPIFDPGPFRGISLIVSPLVTGFVMDRYGEWRERRGGSRSVFATFWGGALFAFGMAIVRFVWTPR
jgi:hypothetical protein